jgi:carbon monoxide dehydrogenase subunit G
MKLQHQTEVGAKPEDVWAFLQDTRAVVQCMPGAELVDELGDDRYEGMLRVAIGPLKMNYAGKASVVERNSEAHRMVINASGRDKRGSGAVQAHVQLQVAAIDAGSRIDVVTDVDLSGRIASLGRGIRDVSNGMFVEFADQLGNRIENPGQEEPVLAASPPTAGQNHESGAAAATRTIGAAPTQRPAGQGKTNEIKVFALVWTITRERFADLLERLSVRVRPR